MAASPAPPGPAASTPAVPWFLRSRWRLATLLLVVLVVPLGIFTTSVVLRAREKLADQASRQNEAAADLASQVVESHFEGLSRYVESYARRKSLAAALLAGDAVAVRAELQEFVDGNTRFDRVFFATPAGVEIYDWPHDPAVIGRSFADRDWYKGVSTTQHTYVSEVYLRAAAPRVATVAVTTPVMDEGRRLTGYLVAQITMGTLTRRLEAITPGESGALTLIDHHGRLAVQGDRPMAEPSDLTANPTVQRMRAGTETTFIGPEPREGVVSLLSSAKVGTIDWLVAASQPTEAVYAPAVALQRAIIGLSVLCLAVMLGVGFLSLSIVRRQHLALIELQEAKDRLTGMIVHDLRNPLAATIGSIDLVADSADRLDSDARRDLDRAAVSARRVLSMTDTLVDVMRMEEGQLELHRARVDLAGLVRSKVDEYRPLARASGVRLEQVVPEAPLGMSADEGLIERVLDNLITNAIKHTPSGGRVEVRVEREPAGGRLALSISDTGEGIPPEDLPRLFQKFARASGQTLGRPRDAGLGLVFCRMAVELHRGVIRAESVPGQGSTFRVFLPEA